MVAPFISQKIGEDQKKKKKRFSLQNELVFSPKVCDDPQKMVFSYQSGGFRSQKKKKIQMVSPQNGDTRSYAMDNYGVDKKQCNGLGILIPKIGHYWSNELDDLLDSWHRESVITTDPIPTTAFSKPFGASYTASSFTVYSMSPRTSELDDYYRQPKSFFESQSPLTNASKITGRYCNNGSC